MREPNRDIHSSSYVHPNTVIGRNVRIGPHCSIGYDGFQFSRRGDGTPQPGQHRGGVIIEDGVEIRACVSIARGLGEGEDTIIRRGTKIDDLVHIGHNCDIGEGNLVVTGTTFAGGVRTGKNNFFGMNCTIGGNVGDCNMIGMGAVTVEDIPDHEVWAGNPARKLRDNLMFKEGGRCL